MINLSMTGFCKVIHWNKKVFVIFVYYVLSEKIFIYKSYLI